MKFEAKRISKNLGQQRVLDRVSLSIGSGEIVGLIGPNGAGKTTTLKILSGETEPDEGEISLDDHSIKALSASERAKLGIKLFPQKEKVENRRSELAAFVAEDTKLLILDDLLVGLDSASTASLKELLVEFRKKMIGILLSDFNVRRTLGVADRAYLIYDGRIVTSGSSGELLK